MPNVMVKPLRKTKQQADSQFFKDRDRRRIVTNFPNDGLSGAQAMVAFISNPLKIDLYAFFSQEPDIPSESYGTCLRWQISRLMACLGYIQWEQN
jgi:hypothetical protein